MEATVYKIEVDNKDILFFEDFIKRMSMKVLEKEEKRNVLLAEKDPTKMSKDEFFDMVDNRRKGNFKKMTREERKAHLGV